MSGIISELRSPKIPLTPLHSDHSHSFHDCENQDGDEAYGCDVFYHDGVEFFHLECSVYFGFFDDGFWFDDVAYEDAGEEGYDWHHDAVAYEVAEVKKAHSHRCYEVPYSKT